MNFEMRLTNRWLSIGLTIIAFIVATLTSCQVNEAVVLTTLKLQLNDSLSVNQGKYDSVRINLYDGKQQLFIDNIFHGPYDKTRDSVTLANLPLGSQVPDPLLIEVIGYRNNGDIIKMSMTILKGTGSDPNVVLISAKLPDTAHPKSIVFQTSNPLTFTVGDSGILLRASVMPTKADQGLKWTSTNPSVANIFNKDLGKDSIQPGVAGNAILTATSTVDTTVYATLFVVVSQKIIHPASIAIQTQSPLILSLTSSPYALSASILPNTADPRIEWLSQHPLIANIENGNFVRPISIGTATVVARSVEDSSVKATLTIQVLTEVIAPNEVQITNTDSLTLSVGGATIPLVAKILPPGADQRLSWISLDNTVATISVNHHAIGLKAGKTALIAASLSKPHLTDTIFITVQNGAIPPESMSLEMVNPLVLILQSPSVKLKASITPAGANQEVSWISANPLVATVANFDFATPIMEGETQFTAISKADTNIKKTLNVKVQAPIISPKEISLLVPDTMRLAVGSTEGTVAAKVEPTGAKQVILWSIADTTIANMTASNTVKPLKAGKTIITARVKENLLLTKTIVVEVIEPVVVKGITMLPETLALYTGGAYGKVTVTLQGNDSGAKYSLTSSAPLIASVKTDGTVMGLKAGKATIMASPVGYPSLLATCEVDVKTDLPDISLSPTKDTTVAYGGQVSFKVTVTQAYGTVAEIKADLDGNGAYDSIVFGVASATFTAYYSQVGTVNTKFEVKDSEGNMVSLIRKITISPPGLPEVTITDPVGPISIRTTTYNIKFSVKDPATGLTTSKDSLVTGLLEGPNTVTVTRSNAGGEGKADVSITVNTAPVGAPKYFGNTTTRGAVRSDFGTYFNQITPENESKWGTVEKTRDQFSWSGADDVSNYAKTAGIPWKFHPLIWGSQIPSWLSTLTPAEQLEEVTEWMDAAKTRYPDVDMIDVVNEAQPGHSPFPYSAALGGAGASGYDWIFTAFKMARDRWPNAILVYNDYNNLEFASSVNWTVNMLAAAKLANAPIDAIGCQAHSLKGVNADTLKTNLDKLAATGLPILISEYDIANVNDTLQANTIKEQFPIMWQHPSVIGVTYWGYVDGATWITGSSLLNSTGGERPSMTWLKTYIAENPTPPNNFPDFLK
jgi:endo-1,4-beta-xylanase